MQPFISIPKAPPFQKLTWNKSIQVKNVCIHKFVAYLLVSNTISEKNYVPQYVIAAVFSCLLQVSELQSRVLASWMHYTTKMGSWKNVLPS